MLESNGRPLKGMGDMDSFLGCTACKAAMVPVDGILTNSVSQKLLKLVADEICMLFKIYGGDKDVCKGAIDTMAGELLPAVADGVLSS